MPENGNDFYFYIMSIIVLDALARDKEHYSDWHYPLRSSTDSNVLNLYVFQFHHQQGCHNKDEADGVQQKTDSLSC